MGPNIIIFLNTFIIKLIGLTSGSSITLIITTTPVADIIHSDTKQRSFWLLFFIGLGFCMILLIPILQWCRTNLGNKEIIRMIPKGEVIVGKLSIINNKLKRSKEVDNVKGQKKFNK